MKALKSSTAFSYATEISSKTFTLVYIILVSRLLTPTEFGVFTIASSITLIVSELKTFGAGNYLIRSDFLNKKMVKAALGLTIIINWSIALIVFLSADLVEKFYKINGLSELLAIMGISFIISPYISISFALFKREFLFKRIFIIEVCSQLILTVTTIVFIYFDCSFYSLALGSLFYTLFQLLCCIIYRTNHMQWLPGFDNLGEIAKFGGYVSSARIAKRITMNLPELLIGKLYGPYLSAIYSRANGLMDFLSATIVKGAVPVATPYIAHLKRTNNNLEKPYCDAIQLLCSIVWPILAVAAACSDLLINVFFGSQWAESAELATLLCLTFTIRTLSTFNPIIFISTGHEKNIAIKEYITLLLAIISLTISVKFGVKAVAYCVTAISLFEAAYEICLLSTLNRFSYKRLVNSITQPLILAIILFYFTKNLIDYINNYEISILIKLMGISFSNFCLWLALAKTLNNPTFSLLLDITKDLINNYARSEKK